MILRKTSALALTAALLASAVLAPAPGQAEDAAAFYKGKTVRFVVGFGTGGGFDAYARMLAPHLAKALDASVIVENQPGAGGLIALNRVAAAPPEGLQLMIVDGTPAALGQLLQQENVRYDLTRMDHLGMISGTRFVWLVDPKSPIKSLADAVKPGTRIRWGGAGPTDGPTGGAAITCEALKLDCQIILGYRGSSDMILAMTRGEVDANYLSESTSYNLIKSNQARALGVAARDRSKLLPDVPTLFEALQLDAEQQWWLDFRGNLNDLGRILVTTGGTPADRLAFLRAAVKHVLTDPDVIAEGDKTGRIVEFREPEVARRKAASVLQDVTTEQKERIRDVALKKYLQ